MFSPDQGPAPGPEPLPTVRDFRCACQPPSPREHQHRREPAPGSPAFALQEALRGLHALFVPERYENTASAESHERHQAYASLGKAALAHAGYDDERAAEILARFNGQAAWLSRPHFDAWQRSPVPAFWQPILQRTAAARDSQGRPTNVITAGARELHRAILRLSGAEPHSRRGATPAPTDLEIREVIQDRARLVLLTARDSYYRTPRLAAYQAIVLGHLLARYGTPPPPGSDPAAWAARLPEEPRWEDFAAPLPPPATLWAALPAAVQEAAGSGAPEQRLIAARSWFYKELRALVERGVTAGALSLEEATATADNLCTVARWLVQGSQQGPTRRGWIAVQSLDRGRGAAGDEEPATLEWEDPGAALEDLVLAADPQRWAFATRTLLDQALGEDRIWSVLLRHLLLRRAGRPFPPEDDRSAVAALRAAGPPLLSLRAGYDPLPVYAHLGSAAVRARYPHLTRLADWMPGGTLQGRGEDVINDIIKRKCPEWARQLARRRSLDESERHYLAQDLAQDLQIAARWLLGHERDWPRAQRRPRKGAVGL